MVYVIQPQLMNNKDNEQRKAVWEQAILNRVGFGAERKIRQAGVID